MVRLIIQKKKKNPKTKETRYNNNKWFVCSVKFLDLFLWCPILLFAVDVLGFMGKATASFVSSLEEKTGGLFSFPAFIGLMACLLKVEL
jgi:hypothetical protein